jgi:hypothetical protein
LNSVILDAVMDNASLYLKCRVDLSARPERLLTHSLQDVLPHLRGFRSLKALYASDMYARHKEEIETALSGCEYGFYNEEPTTARPKRFYRAVFWNLSGELNYECFLEAVKNHPILRKADFFLFSNADIGMGRTRNANFVRSLALDLQYNYVFACSHLYLQSHPKVKDVENLYGITGQAILTPHSPSWFYTIPVASLVDPLKREVKRVGCEKALVVQVPLPGANLHLVCARLDSSSSPRQRARQMRMVLGGISPEVQDAPLLFGGGLNTTTYNSRHAVPQFFSFFNKVVRGYDYICEEHHTAPEKYFDKRVFDRLRAAGLGFDGVNEIGAPTVHCPFEDLEVQGGFGKRVSHMMVRFIRKFFYHGPEQIALKVDWFAANGHVKPSTQPQAERPKVLSNLYHESEVISTHHPIVLDFEMN